MAASLDAIGDVVPAVEHVRGVSRAQDLERLGLQVHLGPCAALVVELQTAIGGELGGATVAGGLRAVVKLR